LNGILLPFAAACAQALAMSKQVKSMPPRHGFGLGQFLVKKLVSMQVLKHC